MSALRRLYVIALLATASCALSVSHTYLQPWFRVDTTERRKPIPHVWELGGDSTLAMLVDGTWKELKFEGPTQAVAIDGGVLVSVYERRDRPQKILFYREASPDPISIPTDRCDTLVVNVEPPRIGCFSCDDGKSLGESTYRGLDACKRIAVLAYDTSAKLVLETAVDSPIVRPEVEGMTPAGKWIIAEHEQPKDFLLQGAPYKRFELGDAGLVELPFGADPLDKQPGSEERAKEIIAEIPIRDRAIAELTARFAETEKPGRTLAGDVVNRLWPPLGTGWYGKKRSSTCYDVELHATADLEEIDLEVIETYADMRDPPPPLVHERGKTALSGSFCVPAGPVQEPSGLRLEVHAHKGKGYVMARVYERPAP